MLSRCCARAGELRWWRGAIIGGCLRGEERFDFSYLGLFGLVQIAVIDWIFTPVPHLMDRQIDGPGHFL